MTEEIIKSIMDAEAQAAEMKREASEKAAKILSDAETQAARLEQSSVEVCKAYRESQTKTAIAEAEERYRATIAAKEKDTKEYCTRVLEGADVAVSKIVGRIVCGNR